MKPFLFLGIRPEDDAAEEEYDAIRQFGGLRPEELERIRVEQAPILPIDLDDYSGIIVGGSPFNWSIPNSEKTELQQRVENEFQILLGDIVKRDFPFLGICYGIGALGTHQGAKVDFEFGETPGPILVSKTAAGQSDPILKGLPDEFYALTAHKEAISFLPENASLLASSAHTPVQMFKVKNNVYATQFHPELDIPGFVNRIRIYKNHGYFKPEELEATIKHVSSKPITHPAQIIGNFITRYAR